MRTQDTRAFSPDTTSFSQPPPGHAQEGLRRATTPADEWAALAPLLAAQGRVRISRDGGRTYRTNGERSISCDLPNQPAAVRTYDRHGCAPCLVFDLDSSRGNVDSDFDDLTGLLNRNGIAWFSDRSPNGGRHIYAPLAAPAPLHELKSFYYSLEAALPTLDKSPMMSALSGCIRPPGARHKSGGHQRLEQSLSHAVDVMHRPAPTERWNSLRAQITREMPDAPREERTDTEQLPPLPHASGPDPEYTRMARTGDFPSSYRSPSEARQAVLWACATSGWTLADVVSRMHNGTWPGLASWYARYSPTHRHKALARDWRNAIAFEQRRRSTWKTSVQQCTTSTHKTQGGGSTGPSPSRTAANARTESARVREWLEAVDLLQRSFTRAEKAVLYALAEAATLTGKLVVEHGSRSLSLATGLDASTVSRALKRLRDAPSDRRVIELLQEAQGVKANAYALTIPPLLVPTATTRPWRKGRIHAIRPVFRELGMVSAFAHMVLEAAGSPLSTDEIAARAGIGRSTAYETMAGLHAWGIVDRRDGLWALGSASLSRLAEQFGVVEQVEAQRARYEAERRAWWQYLGLFHRLTPASTAHAPALPREAEVLPLHRIPASDPGEAHSPPTHPTAWYDADEHLLALLSSVLGASEIATQPSN